MAKRRAWVLNLDADEELAGRTASAAMLARLEPLTHRLERLLAPGDVILNGRTLDASFLGAAFCLTPSALARMRAAQVELPRAPPFEVLRRVNHRRFNAELGQTLPGAVFASSLQEVERAVSAGGTWLLKRAFGFAGRGRRRVTGLTDEDRAWIARSRGGLQVEPEVDRSEDFALHGEIGEDGRLRLGHLTRQVCDRFGAWQKSELAEGPDLDEEATRVARALFAAGYFGPFNIDAYRYAGGFNPRSEINARYSMGWGVGFSAGARERADLASR
jgi:hypothetical protein